MRSGGGFWQGQGCEQSLEKAVWQGRDPDVVEVNLNSPLFLSVTRVRRSGLGARHCLTCSYLPQTVSGWTRPGHAAAEVGLPVREDQCVGATESTRRSELVFRFLSITSSCLGWTLSLPSQLFHLLPPDTVIVVIKECLQIDLACGRSFTTTAACVFFQFSHWHDRRVLMRQTLRGGFEKSIRPSRNGPINKI
ncbi:hypothetical protein T01_5057 [Trichinella spiralis]|uniref:Uncharacterized protein n=1 Tax=Trichinella spiralis TaxID=6334 RepID=A0A0V1BNR6_TRISP|nr:hypothetical protein T01_5057 [Trichinella spiralis]